MEEFGAFFFKFLNTKFDDDPSILTLSKYLLLPDFSMIFENKIIAKILKNCGRSYECDFL